MTLSLIPQSFPKTQLTPSNEQLLSDLFILVKDESFELRSSRFLTKKTFQNLLDNLHASYCPSYSSIFASCSTAITESFCSRCENLVFANYWLHYLLGTFFSILCWSFKNLVLYLLKIEYSQHCHNA